MPISPVKTRIPLTSFGHLITEVKKWQMPWKLIFPLDDNLLHGQGPGFLVAEVFVRQLLGIKAPAPAELTGWRKYFNSYTLEGRRNYVLATYGIMAATALAYMLHRRNKKEEPSSTA